MFFKIRFCQRVITRIVICTNNTFVNNSGIRLKFTRYLKESLSLRPDEDFSFNYFSKSCFVRVLSSKLSGEHNGHEWVRPECLVPNWLTCRNVVADTKGI